MATVAKHIAMSSKLQLAIKAAAGLPTDEDEFEDVELKEETDVSRLKKDPSERYATLVNSIIEEITPELKQQAGDPEAKFRYRWSVLWLRSGRLVSEDSTSLVVPLLKRPVSETEKQSERVAFYTEDKSQIELVKWQTRTAELPLEMYLLDKGIRLGVRTPYILFILILFTPLLPDRGVTTEKHSDIVGEVKK